MGARTSIRIRIERLPNLPQLPTLAGSGHPGFSATNCYDFVASYKVPKPLLERWNLELVKVLKSPDVVEQLNKRGLIPMSTTRNELARHIAAESSTWSRAIRERNITMECALWQTKTAQLFCTIGVVNRFDLCKPRIDGNGMDVYPV